MAARIRIPRRDWGYFFPYLLVGGVFFLVQATGQWRGIGLLIGFVAVPIFDALAGPDKENLTQAEEDALAGRLYYRIISLGWVPVQIGLMVFAFYQLHAKGPPVWFAALLAIPFGFMSGGIGITVAHELGHRSNAWDKWGARILLLSVGYAHFLVEHNRGHHIRVATPPDPATARLGRELLPVCPPHRTCPICERVAPRKRTLPEKVRTRCDREQSHGVVHARARGHHRRFVSHRRVGLRRLFCHPSGVRRSAS